jgi:galactonate dehydratase
VKIVEVEPILAARGWVVVKITTDQGLVGWGECLGDKASTVAAAVAELRRYLIGRDPLRIEYHWNAMYRGAFWRGGPILNAAISGVDIALWDILGKSLGQPIWRVMGGNCRDKIRLYMSPGGSTPEYMADRAVSAVERGFTALKWCPTASLSIPVLAGSQGARLAAKQVETVREAVGYDVDILLDFHGQLSPAMAVTYARAVEPYRPMFIEEPTLPEHSDRIPHIAQMTSVPIATGERIFTRYGFRPILEAGGVGMIQPDLGACGGLSEARKIAAMADAYGVGVGPHNAYGPILFVAALHLDASIPNFVIQEHQEAVSMGQGVFKEPLQSEGGYIRVPDGPGLGVEIDEAALRDGTFTPRDLPILTNEDGSIADW